MSVLLATSATEATLTFQAGERAAVDHVTHARECCRQYGWEPSGEVQEIGGLTVVVLRRIVR